jgi:anti-sigma-K factor RskA
MSAHVDELLALYALGGLETDEFQTVTAHLAICPTCQAEAQRQTALVSALAASIPPRQPNPRLRAEVLSKVGVAPRPSSVARPPKMPARQPLRWGRTGWLAAGFAVLVVALIGWNVYLTNQVLTLQHRVQYNQNALALIAGANTSHRPLVGQGAFAAANGNAYIDQKTQDVVLVVQQLQPLGPDETYQAWIMSANGPVNAGLFQVSDNGWGMTWLKTPYVQGGFIGVSLEPKNGSSQPTKVVLVSTQ